MCLLIHSFPSLFLFPFENIVPLSSNDEAHQILNIFSIDDKDVDHFIDDNNDNYHSSSSSSSSNESFISTKSAEEKRQVINTIIILFIQLK